LQLVLDPAPALQAHGLLQLARLVRARPPELCGAADLSLGAPSALVSLSPLAAGVLEVSLRQLDCSDAYVFLAAVELLRSFAERFPADALPRLLALYAAEEGGAPARVLAPAPTSGDVPPPPPPPLLLSLRTRVKLGESLTLAAQSAGRSGALPAHALPLLRALMRVGVAGWRRHGELAARLLGAAGGGAEAYNVALEITDFADLRASALACLGETAAFLGPALAAHAGDVIGGLCGVLQMEARPRLPPSADGAAVDAEALSVATEAGARVRRAAALALRRIVEGGGGGGGPGVRGLASGRGSLLGALGPHLRPLYAALQATAAAPVRGAGGDPDALVRAHTRDALAAVDDVMRTFISSGDSGGGGGIGGGGPRLTYL